MTLKRRRQWFRVSVFAAVLATGVWVGSHWLIVSLTWRTSPSTSGGGFVLAIAHGTISLARVRALPLGRVWFRCLRDPYPSFRIVPEMTWSSSGFQDIEIPLWTAVLPLAIAAVLLHPSTRSVCDRCSHCGYDISGLGSGCCPECGHGLDGHGPRGRGNTRSES